MIGVSVIVEVVGIVLVVAFVVRKRIAKGRLHKHEIIESNQLLIKEEAVVVIRLGGI